MFPENCYGNIDIAISRVGSALNECLSYYVLAAVPASNSGLILSLVDGGISKRENGLIFMNQIRCLVKNAGSITLKKGDCIRLPAGTKVAVIRKNEIVICAYDFSVGTPADATLMNNIIGSKYEKCFLSDDKPVTDMTVVTSPASHIQPQSSDEHITLTSNSMNDTSASSDVPTNKIFNNASAKLDSGDNNGLNNTTADKPLQNTSTTSTAHSSLNCSNDIPSVFDQTIANPVVSRRDIARSIKSEPYPSSGVISEKVTETNNDFSGYLADEINADSNGVVKIADINKFLLSCTIVARLTEKSEIKNFVTDKGVGRRVALKFIDDTGEIDCTLWSNSINVFYDILDVGEVYEIKNPIIKESNLRYRKSAHDCNLIFHEKKTIVTKVNDPSIPTRNFVVKPLEFVASGNVGDTFSTIGVITRILPVSDVLLRKEGVTEERRNVYLSGVDLVTYPLTVWGKVCHIFPDNVSDNRLIVVELESVKIDEYNGRRLKATASSKFYCYYYELSQKQFSKLLYENDELTEKPVSATALSSSLITFCEQFTERNKNGVQSLNLSNDNGQLTGSVMDICDFINEAASLFSDKVVSKTAPMMGNIVARIKKIVYRNNGEFWYDACPKCNRKVELDSNIQAINSESWEDNGFELKKSYNCRTCALAIDKPIKRYSFSIDIEDHTGLMNCLVFDSVGLMLLKTTVSELLESSESQDFNYDSQNFDQSTGSAGSKPTVTSKFNELIGNEFLFKLTAKPELYNDSVTVKFVS